jgi:hypothetical protein
MKSTEGGQLRIEFSGLQGSTLKGLLNAEYVSASDNSTLSIARPFKGNAAPRQIISLNSQGPRTIPKQLGISSRACLLPTRHDASTSLLHLKQLPKPKRPMLIRHSNKGLITLRHGSTDSEAGAVKQQSRRVTSVAKLMICGSSGQLGSCCICLEGLVGLRAEQKP